MAARTFGWACGAAALWVLVVGAAAAAGEGGGGAMPGFVRIPNPLSGENPTYPAVARGVPGAGESFRCARFRTALTRVTGKWGLRHWYARYDPFNSDGSLIVLHRTGEGDHQVFRTRGAPYDQKANLVAAVDMEEPQWDAKDPQVLWGLNALRIVTFRCDTGKTAVVKDFRKDPTVGPIVKAEKDLYRVTTKGEGEPCCDRRFWALLLQGTKQDYRLRYLITWDRKSDQVLGVRKLAPNEEVDWAGMSWKGTFVIIGGDQCEGKISGLTMADKALKRFHRLARATAHSDVGLTTDGREVIVMQNSRTDHIDMIPLDWKAAPVRDGDNPYAGSGKTPLVRLFYASGSPHGFGGGVHISCNAPGVCVVSTYTEPNVKERNWLDRGIILVRLDARDPKAWHLAKVHGTKKAYWEETHAAITRDGSRVVWASNWNQDVGRERVFVLQLTMPANWRRLLK